MIPALKAIYEWYGRPRFVEGPSVLLKQVNFPNELLADTARVLSPRILAVVRNPLSSISSTLKYYRDRNENPRDPEAVARVRELLAMPGYESMRQYAASLETMPLASFETLRWRIQTEPLVSFLREYHSAHLVIYERVAQAQIEEFEKMYSFLGWTFSDDVRDFITATATAKSSVPSSRQEFSVYQDANESLDKWRKNLTEAEHTDALTIYRDSPLRDLWPEIE